jgi:hypothetical protein
MAIKIRENPKIKGIKVLHSEHEISHFAEFHDIESKAFSKSINKNKPGISFSSAYSIISSKSLIFSPMYLPAIKP